MKDIIDDYGDAVVAVIACIELIAVVCEFVLFSSNPQSLAGFIDMITQSYQ